MVYFGSTFGRYGNGVLVLVTGAVQQRPVARAVAGGVGGARGALGGRRHGGAARARGAPPARRRRAAAGRLPAPGRAALRREGVHF